jgi:hypothetical protein
MSLARLRNNNPNLMARYLELYLTKSELLEEFTIFFSNMNDSFKYIETTFIKLVFLLQNIYKKRYIEKAYVHTTPVLHNFLKSLSEKGLVTDQEKLHCMIKEELGKLSVGVVYNMILNYFNVVE